VGQSSRPEAVDSPVTTGDAVITPVGVEFDADGVVWVDGGSRVLLMTPAAWWSWSLQPLEARRRRAMHLRPVYPVVATVTVTVEESLGLRPVTGHRRRSHSSPSRRSSS